jgi:hypothetical protein
MLIRLAKWNFRWNRGMHASSKSKRNAMGNLGKEKPTCVLDRQKAYIFQLYLIKGHSNHLN